MSGRGGGMEGRWCRMGLFVCLFVFVGEKWSFYMD